MEKAQWKPYRERETEFTKDVRPYDSGCLSKAIIHLRVKIMMMKIFIKVSMTTPITKQVSEENTISRENVGGALGPLRDYAHIRSSKIFDYQLNICNV